VRRMDYGSLFTGMGGIDLAFDRAGMTCVFQAEKEPKCWPVLEKHWPQVKRFEDVHDVNTTAVTVRPDWIAGGFPCQDLSVAGKRAGLAGQRSGLFWEFVRILGEFRPGGVLLENVPGLLSSNEGRDMRTVVDALGELGYGWAYRILDAQWFGVPQRRRRVFIVGCLGDGRRAARILFEPESLPWDSPPRREARTRVAASITAGSASGSGVNRPGRRREGDVNLAISHALTGEGHDASEDGTGRGTPLAVSFSLASHPLGSVDAFEPVTTRNGDPGCVAFQSRFADNGRGAPSDVMYSLTKAMGDGGQTDRRPQVAGTFGVRRLMPIECLRLQGFPDDWLDGLGLSNSAKYRMAGNAVAVPVVEWIARRIVNL
jgi:DNA (cytosine-5)-methyltransferase 1